MEDEDIYDDPSSNGIDFNKLRQKFQTQSSEEAKRQSRPPLMKKPRESLIAQRIQNLQSKGNKKLEGRESVVSILPPNIGALPPKTLPTKTKKQADDNTSEPIIPPKTKSPGTQKVPVLPSSADSGVVLRATAKQPGSLSPDKRTSRPDSKSARKRESAQDKENTLPPGLKVGMIVKGNDGKSYRLLPLPSNSGPPPPAPPPPPDNIDLSKWMDEDEDLYDDVEITQNIRASNNALKRGSMRPVSEIIPMTEEEEEEFEKQKALKKLSEREEDEEIYDDTLEEEVYDDVGEVQVDQLYEAV